MLSPNIYWSDDDDAALVQAQEINNRLSGRDDKWAETLEQRGVIMNALKIVGYVKCTEAHRLLLDGIISCCVNSDKICESCVSNGLIIKLKYCIKQKGNQAVQIQGGKGLARIVSKRQFIDGFYTQNQNDHIFLDFVNTPLHQNLAPK